MEQNIDKVYTMPYTKVQEVVWDERKNELLMSKRGLSFEPFADMIISGEYIAMLKSPSRNKQFIFLCKFNDYIHIVPCVRKNNRCLILKTVYPSRKYQKLYGGEGS